jgi:hypothetical protein
MKTIQATSFNPQTSMFKSLLSDRAEVRSVACDQTERCDIFARGMCIRANALGTTCVYGRNKTLQGPTKRGKCGEFITENLPKLDIPANVTGTDDGLVLANVGDYIYVNLLWANFNSKSPMWERTASAFSSGLRFIRKEKFDKEACLAIFRHKPLAINAREIIDYQREEVPKFVKALRTFAPEIFAALSAEHADFKAASESHKCATNVGQWALLRTLLPFEDKEWKWDGENLIFIGEPRTFMLWSGLRDRSGKIIKPKGLVMKVAPEPDLQWKVPTDDCVGPETEFTS